MKHFAGSYTHKLDAKGRVSLPVSFRKTLSALGSEYTVVIPQYYSDDYHVGLSQAGHEALIDQIDRRTDIEQEDRDGMLSALVAEAHLLVADDAGRIVLPRELREALGLKGEVLFRGLGTRFHIWNPARHAAVEGERGERRRAAPRVEMRSLHG